MEEIKNVIEVENIVESSPLIKKRSNKTVFIIVGIVIAVIIGILVAVIISSNNSYKNAYDKYCKALNNCDAKEIVNMCPKEYINFICQETNITKQDLIGYVQDYIIENIQDIQDTTNYKEYHFLSSSQASKTIVEDDYNDFCYAIAFYCYEKSSDVSFGDTRVNDADDIYEAVGNVMTIKKDVAESISKILPTDIKVLDAQIKLDYDEESTVENIVLCKTHGKWYLEDAMEYVYYVILNLS